jgi:hypothetical protein
VIVRRGPKRLEGRPWSRGASLSVPAVMQWFLPMASAETHKRTEAKGERRAPPRRCRRGRALRRLPRRSRLGSARSSAVASPGPCSAAAAAVSRPRDLPGCL